MKQQKLLVIGNGMVGHKAVELLTSQSQYHLQVLGREPRPAYDRVHLSSFFSGQGSSDLSLVNDNFYRSYGIEVSMSCNVCQIDRKGKKVRTEEGHEYAYDKLILATGSVPFVPPVPGRDQPHCHVYRTIEDLLAIQDSARQSRVGVVIGGGLLGLEAAKALHDLGLTAHVVEFAPQLMAVQLDAEGGALLKEKIEALGVGVHTGKNTLEIIAGTEQRYRMNFADNTYLETDMIVFSAGIRPQDDLARQAGLAVGERGGIVINQFCQTSDPDIYAIGECALRNGRIFGLVAPGYEMARVAVAHLNGQTDECFNGADMSTRLKLLGVDVAAIGDAHGRTPDCCCLSWQDQENQSYRKVVLSSNRKRLLGAVLVGDSKDYDQWLPLMVDQMELPGPPEYMILPEAFRPSSTFDITSMSDDTWVCRCNRVNKGDIRDAIQNGCKDLGSITHTTGAASTCGSCASLIREILHSEA
ncbi:FAD-dependent oxidoreductase [Gynuella sp.]|uniref:FAD-dependent oxidoreductase n=1 Tax=Gynuella sp. TaxID=2969146 RepID=UPI003D0B2BE3